MRCLAGRAVVICPPERSVLSVLITGFMTFHARRSRSPFVQWPRRAIRKVALALRRLTFSGTPLPVFVIGSGRSGTDLLMHCLSQSLEVALLNEDHPAAFQNWRLRDLDVVGRAIHAQRAPVVLLKPIVETQRVAELLDSFPDGRALFIVRHWHDNVNSRAKFFGDDQQRMVEGWLRTDFARFPALPEEIRHVVREAWSSSSTVATAAAVGWLVVNATYEYLGLTGDERVHKLLYEELVQNGEGTLREVCAFVGVPFDPAMLREIYGSSVRKSAPPEVPAVLAERCERLWTQLQGATTGALEAPTPTSKGRV